jgi:5'-3' exonuclease
MGIPAYFSYIIKNHIYIIEQLSKNDSIDNFYLDSNSIIYDCVHSIDFDTLKENEVKYIIKEVFNKINNLISILNPKKNIFIAFDGVAPLAKLDQQRNRRYKSYYQSKITKHILKQKKDPWNTSAITPGTQFMDELNKFLKSKFNSKLYPNNNIILSLSDEPGEGEHKIFNFIRENSLSHKEEKTVVYGLDADLIMLCINHIPICNNLYLYRETPSFIKSIAPDLEPNESYLLNIPLLSKEIVSNMYPDTKNVHNNKIYDYIFICFLLGNDFLPHFPSLNIRTGAINKLINAYKAVISNTEYLTDGKKIIWKNFRKFISFLALNEKDYIIAETKKRKKIAKYSFSEATPEDKLRKFDNTPSFERQLEHFIDIEKDNWEIRYYDCLFNIEIDDVRRKQICMNYLEGLEWTIKYYSSSCPDWKWKYKYDYPPLLTDLINFIPFFETELIAQKPMSPVEPLVQLCYVLPKDCLYLLPKKLYLYLLENHSNWYKNDCEFLWAYCKYFWESHVLLEDIDINKLEIAISNYK